MASVTYDPEARRIFITTPPDATGVVQVDVGRDLYSEAKRQWLNVANLSKHPFPWRTIGGDPLTHSVSAGAYFFLDNVSGWRIVPYPADHEAIFFGNLYREDVDAPLFEPPGPYTVTLRLELSSLTQLVDATGGGDVNVVSVGGIPVASPADLKNTAPEIASGVAQELDGRGLTSTWRANLDAQISSIQSMVQTIYDIEGGTWEIADDGSGNAVMIMYDQSNVEVARFALYEKSGLLPYASVPSDYLTRRERL